MSTAPINRRKPDSPDRIAEIEDQLDELKKKVDEIYEIVAAAKGFFKVLGAIGAGVKWLSLVCAAVGAAWVALKKG